VRSVHDVVYTVYLCIDTASTAAVVLNLLEAIPVTTVAIRTITSNPTAVSNTAAILSL
jgi:hypothetical protein